jgi:hypothetical protein
VQIVSIASHASEDAFTLQKHAKKTKATAQKKTALGTFIFSFLFSGGGGGGKNSSFLMFFGTLEKMVWCPQIFGSRISAK